MTSLCTASSQLARRAALLVIALIATALLPAIALSAPGDLDTGFDAAVGHWVSDAAQQVDGQVVIVGSFTSVGGQTRNRIARVDATTGAVDMSFNPDANGNVAAVAIQSDGKILIGGSFTQVGGVGRDRLARLNADGTLDTTFNPGADAVVRDIVVQPDGAIIVAGSFSTVGGRASGRIGRLNANGTADTGFTQSAVISGAITTLALEADGQVLAGGNLSADTTVGQATTTHYGLLRISTSGVIDPAFTVDLDPVSPSQQTPTNLGHQIDAVAVLPGGKILIGGTFEYLPRGQNHAYFLRLNTDGTLDGAFAPNANSSVTAITLIPDGKMLVGGLFTSVGGASYRGMARLLGTGVADAAFPDPNVSSRSNVIITQLNGGIVLGGNFGTVSAMARPYLARLQGPVVQVTATPAAASITHGDTAPAPGFTATGFAGVDTWITAPTCGIFTQTAPPVEVTTTPVPVGTYDISCSGGDPGPGYVVAYTSGTLTVVAPPEPSAGATPTTATAPTATPAAPAAPSIAMPAARALAGRAIVVTANVSTGGNVSLRGTRGGAVACTGSAVATQAGQLRVSCRMSTATIRALRTRSISVRVVATITDAHGQSASTERTVRVNRAMARIPVTG